MFGDVHEKAVSRPVYYTVLTKKWSWMQTVVNVICIHTIQAHTYLSDSLLLVYARRELWNTSSSLVCLIRTSLHQTDIIVIFGAKIID